MNFETITFEIGSHLLPYLINGDSSGLEDAEIENFDRWLDNEVGNLPSGHWSVDSEESYFTHNPDFPYLACDVYEVSYNYPA